MNAHEIKNNEPKSDASAKKNRDGKQGQENIEAIPGSKEGVGIGQSSEPNTFEPEEDPDVTSTDKKSSD